MGLFAETDALTRTMKLGRLQERFPPMLRVVALCAFVAVPLAAGAAPVPRDASEKELLARHWGKTEGRGEFEARGTRLTIRTDVPPDTGLIAIIGGGNNAAERHTAPRTARTVRGDFVATVKLLDAVTPNKGAKHTDGYPNTRAGLYVNGGGYAVEFHLYQYYQKANNVAADEPTRTLWVDTWYPRGGSGTSLRKPEPGKSTWLRLARTGTAVGVSHSSDGVEWSAPYTPRKDMEFPDEVTVGAFFGHSTYQTLSATFDNFTVEKPKKKD